MNLRAGPSTRPSARPRRAALAAVSLLVIVIVAGCGRGSTTSTAASGSASSTVAIGALYPTAGAQGLQGTEEERGVALAAEWANEHHALGNRHIRLVLRTADQAETVPADMALFKRQGIDLVVGSHASAVSQAAAAVATQQDQVFWETGAVGETLPGTSGGRNFFRMAPMGSNLGSTAIDFVAHEVAPHLSSPTPLRYAVAYVDDPYGREVGNGAAAEIEKLGRPLVGTFAYDTATVNYADLARRIGAVHPDVLYVSAYIPDGIALRRALVAAHVPLLANIGTSSSYCMLAFGQPLGADAVGLFASDKPDAADVNPAALDAEGRAALSWVSRTYTTRYHEAMSAPALSGFSGAYALFVHVLPVAGSVDASAVARAALHVKLAKGTLANGSGMDLAPPGSPDAGDNRAATSVIWEWVAPGERVVVWPEAFAWQPVRVLPLAR